MFLRLQKHLEEQMKIAVEEFSERTLYGWKMSQP